MYSDLILSRHFVLVHDNIRLVEYVLTLWMIFRLVRLLTMKTRTTRVKKRLQIDEVSHLDVLNPLQMTNSDLLKTKNNIVCYTEIILDTHTHMNTRNSVLFIFSLTV